MTLLARGSGPPVAWCAGRAARAWTDPRVIASPRAATIQPTPLGQLPAAAAVTLADGRVLIGSGSAWTRLTSNAHPDRLGDLVGAHGAGGGCHQDLHRCSPSLGACAGPELPDSVHRRIRPINAARMTPTTPATAPPITASRRPMMRRPPGSISTFGAISEWAPSVSVCGQLICPRPGSSACPLTSRPNVRPPV